MVISPPNRCHLSRIFSLREVLHEEVEIYGQPDNGGLDDLLSKVQLGEFLLAQLPHALALLTGREREERRVIFLQQPKQCLSRSNGVEVPQYLADSDAGVTLFEPVGRIAR